MGLSRTSKSENDSKRATSIQLCNSQELGSHGLKQAGVIRRLHRVQATAHLPRYHRLTGVRNQRSFCFVETSREPRLVIFLAEHCGHALLLVVDLRHQRVRRDGDQRAAVDLCPVLVLLAVP